MECGKHLRDSRSPTIGPVVEEEEARIQSRVQSHCRGLKERKNEAENV